MDRDAGTRLKIRFFREVRSQSFADDRLFVGELAGLNPLSEKPLEVVGDGDIHGVPRSRSSPSLSLRLLQLAWLMQTLDV
jgi:hypothetical protein